MRRRHRGLTRVEVLVVLTVAVALPGILLPAVSAARDRSRATASADNLRLLGAAHLVYAADWNGRQLTFVDDLIVTYGDSFATAFSEYWSDHGGTGEETMHPPVKLGWGQLTKSGGYGWLAYRTGSNCANAALTIPVNFNGEGCNPALAYLGSFRLHNAAQFHQYLGGGRFYDPVFYAPADTVVLEAMGDAFDRPDQYSRFVEVCDEIGEIPAWSSYCLSPAAMFDPAVMAHDDPDDDEFNGWIDPWTLRDGFTSPSFFRARYPSLKTHMLEHHWLQGAPEDCNPAFESGTYGLGCECEPYYFNHGFASRPVTLFYDGRVAELSVLDAILADQQVRDQMNPNWGLWSQDTEWGEDGYFSELGYDGAQTSFHILTTDGIEGRDVTAASSSAQRHVERPGLSGRRASPRPRYPRPVGVDIPLLSPLGE